MSTALTWTDIERITKASSAAPSARLVHSARLRAAPSISASRYSPLNSKNLILRSTIAPIAARAGYVHPERSAQVIDLTERKRLREEAERREHEDKQQRTASALKLWNARQPFVGSPAETYLRVTRGIGDWLDAFDLMSRWLSPGDAVRQRALAVHGRAGSQIETDEPQAIHRTALQLGPQDPNALTGCRLVRLLAALSSSASTATLRMAC